MPITTEVDCPAFGSDPHTLVGSPLPIRLAQTQFATSDRIGLTMEPGNAGAMSPRMTSGNIEKLCHELHDELTR